MSLTFKWLCLVTVIFMCVGLSGCGGSRGPNDEVKPGIETPVQFIWEVEKRPYSVISLDGKYGDDVQHRYVRAYIPDPESKTEVLSAAREIYDEMTTDIEQISPNANYKRIHILIYDNEQDAINFDGRQILMVTRSDGAGPNIPPFDEAVKNWQKRSKNADMMVPDDF